MSDVTRILSQIESGDPAAAEQLLPLVYDELRKLAGGASWPTRSRGRRCRRRRWCMRRTCGWWAKPRGSGIGIEAGIAKLDLGPPIPHLGSLALPRPLLRRRGRGDAADPGRPGPPQATARSAGAIGSGRSSNTWRLPRRNPRSTSSRSDAALERFERSRLAESRAGQAPLLRRPDHPRGRRGPRHLATTADRHWAYARAWLHAELARRTIDILKNF